MATSPPQLCSSAALQATSLLVLGEKIGDLLEGKLAGIEDLHLGRRGAGRRALGLDELDEGHGLLVKDAAEHDVLAIEPRSLQG